MKQATYIALVLAIVLAFLQIGFFSIWRIGYVQPNVAVATIAIAVLLHVNQRLLLYAILVGGVILDAYSTLPFGTITVLLFGLLFLLQIIHRRFVHYAAPLTVILVASASAFIFDSTIALIKGVWLNVGMWYFMENAFYTGVVSAIMLAGVFLVNRRFIGSDVIYIRKRT